jgi:predicted Holliday junction resolvase-like endonuclease
VNWAAAIKFGLKYWRELFVVASLLTVIIKTRMDYQALSRAYEISQQSLQEQVEGLRDAAIREYREAIDAIEETYKNSQEEITRLTNQKRDNLERSYSSNPEELANEIIDTYGFDRSP